MASLSPLWLRRLRQSVVVILPASLILIWQCKPSATESQEDLNVTEIVDDGPQAIALSGEEERDTTIRIDLEIKRGSSFYQTLKEGGLAAGDIFAAIKAIEAKSEISKLNPGTKIEVEVEHQDPSLPLKITLFETSTNRIVAERDPEGNWLCEVIDLPIEREPVTFMGEVELTLWGSAIEAGMDYSVVAKLAEVFAWQIDFNRELRAGDRWRLSVERLSVEGKPFGWGEILAAEYINQGKSHVAVRFPQEGKLKGYFAPDGTNLKKLFLKSPLKFGRISSRFNKNRFHPILKIRRPHNGVDYAAPTGTPIYAVGSGTVTEVSYKKSTGKHIRVRHNSVYETSYSHLSRYAKNMRRGMKVDQGQLIGYVGMTGLATGPHLHFSFYEHRRFVDPLGLKFPSADPVHKRDQKTYEQTKLLAIGSLPHWQDQSLEKEAVLQVSDKSL